MRITQEILNAGMSDNGGWSLLQIRLLGAKGFLKGWKWHILDTEVSEENIGLFLSLKNAHLYPEPQLFPK